MLGIRLEETRVYREAREEEREKIALKMLSENIPLETIRQSRRSANARITELTIEQLQNLRSNNNTDRT